MWVLGWTHSFWDCSELANNQWIAWETDCYRCQTYFGIYIWQLFVRSRRPVIAALAQSFNIWLPPILIPIQGIVSHLTHYSVHFNLNQCQVAPRPLTRHCAIQTASASLRVSAYKFLSFQKVTCIRSHYPLLTGILWMMSSTKPLVKMPMSISPSLGSTLSQPTKSSKKKNQMA